MGAYDKFAVDTDLEQKGVVIDYEEFRVTIARAGGSNKRYQKALEKFSRPFQRAMQTETMSNTKAEDLLKQAYAQEVVLNWEVPAAAGKWKKGIPNPDGGKDLPFNTENVLKVLRDDRLGDLWVDLKNQAGKGAIFRASLAEAQAGN